MTKSFIDMVREAEYNNYYDMLDNDPPIVVDGMITEYDLERTPDILEFNPKLQSNALSVETRWGVIRSLRRICEEICCVERCSDNILDCEITDDYLSSKEK